ncbi:MAG: Trp operon repressor [Candidatus Azotimanducaceae bacterium]|jgi:Trp operon repressor
MAVPVEQAKAKVYTLPTAFKGESLAVVKRIKKVVDLKVSYLLDGLAANVNDALFEEMLSIEERDALVCHFNIMRALKTSEVSLYQEFNANMHMSWVHLVNRRDRQSPPGAVAEMGPLLQIYGDKSLNRYKVLLEEVRLRFCSLVKQELVFHPMLPANFYFCFWQATEKFDLTVSERSLLVPLFNRFVMDRFGQILGAVNQSLTALNVHVSKSGVYTRNIELGEPDIS